MFVKRALLRVDALCHAFATGVGADVMMWRLVIDLGRCSVRRRLVLVLRLMMMVRRAGDGHDDGTDCLQRQDQGEEEEKHSTHADQAITANIGVGIAPFEDKATGRRESDAAIECLRQRGQGRLLFGALLSVRSWAGC